MNIRFCQKASGVLVVPKVLSVVICLFKIFNPFFLLNICLVDCCLLHKEIF